MEKEIDWIIKHHFALYRLHLPNAYTIKVHTAQRQSGAVIVNIFKNSCASKPAKSSEKQLGSPFDKRFM
jgi:hypothetical protein